MKSSVRERPTVGRPHKVGAEQCTNNALGSSRFQLTPTPGRGFPNTPLLAHTCDFLIFSILESIFILFLNLSQAELCETRDTHARPDSRRGSCVATPRFLRHWLACCVQGPPGGVAAGKAYISPLGTPERNVCQLCILTDLSRAEERHHMDFASRIRCAVL